MSELLSREKEFLKLNEELNVKTKVLLEKPVSTKEYRATNLNNVSRQSNPDNSPVNSVPHVINKLGKPPIKPRIVINKASTVPRNNRYAAFVTEANSSARSTPKKGSATFRVIKENQLLNNSHENSNLENQSIASDSFSIYEIYKNENFVKVPSLAVNSVRSDVSTVIDEASSVSAKPETNKGSVSSNSKRSTSRQSSVSNVSSEVVPKKNLSSEGLVKFLKSKVSILETELDASSQELTKRSKELERALETQKRMEMQRDQAYTKNNHLTGQLSKLETRLAEVEGTLKDREAEFLVTGRDMETVKREMRLLTQTNANLEKRLYRSNEELENMKNTLTSVKEAERELQDSVRKEKNDHERETKMLKKQRTELMNAYKKQLYLLDNLKRQTVCLEQARLISFAEKEFTKVLDWNAKN